MAAFKSKMPAGENLTPQMIAYLQAIEKRQPTDTSTIDGAATLADVIARLNALISDLRG